MIKINDLTLAQNSTILIEHSNVFISQCQKVGIMGANGSGKTSLFKALLGQLETQSGEISLPNGLSIAHVEQTIPTLEETALLYVMRAAPHCHQLYTRLIVAENSQDMEQIALLHAELSEINGYYFKAQAEKILHGLGFVQLQIQQTVAAFSGGWRMRLHLARCLLVEADLLLLDEPTNHLDLNGILWLQNWLNQYTGTLLLISHDRDFLDNIVTHILHLDRKKLQLYTGNYTQFVEQRTQALALQAQQYKKQQMHIKHVMSYVDRFRYKASKAKQAQSRLKTLDRIEKIAPVLADHDFNFNFQQPEALSNPLIDIHQVSIGYHKTSLLLQNINLRIDNQSRIGLLGANGAGKSTFLKALMGDLPPISGDIILNSKLKIGYFSQHQVESFDPLYSCLKVMQIAAPQLTENHIRSYLGLFGFSGDKALLQTSKLSGGEKARLALARIFWQRPHILLLDEPTNHLDLLMRDALNIALQNYQGAIIVISHDRFLLRSVVDELWLVNQGTVKEFTGDLDDYTKLLVQGMDPTASELPKNKQTSKSLSDYAQRRLKEIEKLTKKLAFQLENIDHEIIQLSQKNLVAEQDRLQLSTLNKQRQEFIKKIEQLEQEWYQIQD